MPQKKRPSRHAAQTSRQPAPPLPRVAVCLAPYPDYQLGILQGVRSYLGSQPKAFELLTHRGNPYLRPDDLATLQPDGVIANIQQDNAAMFHTLRVPVVKIGARGPDAGFDMVEMDGEQAGRVAASHLIGLGLQHIGCVGVKGAAWSDARLEGFRAGARACGITVTLHEQARGDELEVADSAALATWLLELPRPAGVFAVTDLLARRVIEIARGISLPVPRDLAVLGFNNGLYECLFAEPHLSSVPQDHLRLGAEAARLLAERMASPAGARAEPKSIALCAAPVVRRRTTAVFAWTDPVLRECLEFFNRQLDDAAGLREVFDAYPEERLRLARRLDPASPDVADKTEAARLRLVLAEQLLRETTMPVVSITECCGFWEESRLRLAFKDAYGFSPADYRARFSHPV